MKSSSSHVECTCARSIISGVYFDGVSGVGALLGQVSVGRAIQAAVTHSVQVAAICPNTTRVKGSRALFLLHKGLTVLFTFLEYIII